MERGKKGKSLDVGFLVLVFAFANSQSSTLATLLLSPHVRVFPSDNEAPEYIPGLRRKVG